MAGIVQERFASVIRTPLCARKVISGSGTTFIPAGSKNLNFCASVAITSAASVSANICPMQRLGPPPKRMITGVPDHVDGRMLAITEAARRRLFFQQQLEEAKDELTKAEEAMRETQQSTGVLQIDSQARSLIESAAILRGQVVAKLVQIQSMRSFAAEDNPALVLAKQELAALEVQLERVAGSQPDNGSDLILSKGRVTGAGLEYLRRLRDLKYNETVFELLAKQFEIAKLDEAREGSIVQVVDYAVVPDKRSSPHRLLIIVGTIIFSLFAACFWVVMREGWTRSFELPENQQRIAAIKERWKGTPDTL